MVRTIQVSPPGKPSVEDSKLLVIKLELITPLVGGGTVAGKVDDSFLIRPTAIRGALRFWWRATRGKTFLPKKDPIQSMKNREDTIWGSIESSSPVSINIENVVRKRNGLLNGKNHDLDIKNIDSSLKYVFFPFRDATGFWTDKDRICFTLVIRKTISYDPAVLEEIECAIWAWIMFGGLGARTRRGCGALHCLQVELPEGREPFPFSMPGSKHFQDFQDWLRRCFDHYGVPNGSLGDSAPWPVVESVLARLAKDQINGWLDAVNVLRHFRQGKGVGRDSGQGKVPGRSRWPEAESIRSRVLEQKKMKRPMGPGKNNMKKNDFTVDWKEWDSRLEDGNTRIEGYPRAEFGLPIIMELRHNQLKRDQPLKVTIQKSDEIDRLASPIIIRPGILGDGICVSLIIRLATPGLDQAYLKKGDHDLIEDIPIKDPSKIHGPQLAKYPESPMMGRSNGSAVDAFIKFVQEKEQGWRKVA